MKIKNVVIGIVFATSLMHSAYAEEATQVAGNTQENAQIEEVIVTGLRKDLADARGLESSYGSPIFAGTMPTKDSLPIARIRAHGAIFIGKTNTSEFGLGSQTYNAVHGTTRNAYDPLLII